MSRDLRSVRQTQLLKRIRSMVAGALILALTHELPAAEPADLVVKGGKVVTMVTASPLAEAVAILGDRIAAVGSNSQIDAWIGSGTRIIELDGQLVIPGLVEGHGHFVSLGQSKMELDLTQATSWDDIVQQVYRASLSLPAGQWIIGRGWHQGKWSRRPNPHVEGYPVHGELSQRTPRHPVLLTHRTGHMLFANALAMRLAGIDAETADVPGGEILRDEIGPTGVFRENAMSLVRRARTRSLQNRSPAQVRQELSNAIRLASEECLANGVTSFQDAGASLAEVDLFRELAEEGQLDVRLFVMLNEPNGVLAGRLADYRMVGVGNHHLTVRAIKRMVDGALGTHGAWLLAPYDDLPNNTGHNTTSLDSLKRVGELALEHDFQLCVHAIGDRANREVLDLFESLGTRGKDLRWRIEHAQHISPPDIARFAELSVIASMQAVHCTSDAPFVVQRLGQRRARTGAYVWRSLLDSGAVVTNGTDVPVERIDPFACIYASVTRKLANGVAFFAEQRMTREEALRSYTRAAAYAAFEEHLKGSLAAGMLADLVVLDRDLLTVPEDQIAATRVQFTIVGGKIKYQSVR